MKKWPKVIKLNPSQLLVSVFLIAIAIGTLLLKLPISVNKPIGWSDALFVTTSAMTVTGLSTVDPSSVFTVFGQTVIALLIQIGGLGIMSFAVLIYMMLGRKIGMKERLLMQQALNQTSVGGVVRLVRRLFVFSFIIEFIAMIFLSFRWVPEFGWSKGLFYSFFHAVSAFNNAGFALFPNNLMNYAGDPLINIVISLLFIIGGIGFTVLVDIWNKKRFKKFSLHTKLMVAGTIVINLIAMFVLFFIEYSNPHTLGALSFGDKLWASYFQAVSPRTAGFNTINIADMKDSSLFFMVILMFIGAGSASTGGGIKLTTALVIFLATITFVRGKTTLSIGRRSLNKSYIAKALAITVVSLLFIVLAIFIMNLTEKASFLQVLFEVVSAFGTVGLSMNLTASLSLTGKLVIIFIMFLGKLGPLTLMFSLATPEKELTRYPEEDILTG
ncbi:TrkH family potassium uptake protein [Metabacillus sp. GX 13764]|uniref:TrkH family potassium uptake protein n=1 Tax=Metabacillus kandeliae TaxID=2900151 RepID=UPI001E5E5A2A|nr:TrkH family potassium uptake protein [Metabacillus kandeliae]MCD7036303.1 TrkH family potassium uptake protein [Metabacillus kandeliae]